MVTACAGLSTTSNALQLLPFRGPAVAALQTERAPDILYNWAAANIQLMPFASGISYTFALSLLGLPTPRATCLCPVAAFLLLRACCYH